MPQVCVWGGPLGLNPDHCFIGTTPGDLPLSTHQASCPKPPKAITKGHLLGTSSLLPPMGFIPAPGILIHLCPSLPLTFQGAELIHMGRAGARLGSIRPLA